MNNCDGNCNTCKSDCSNKCPVCGATSTAVLLETVKSLIKNKDITLLDDTYICLNRKCNVAYFDANSIIYKSDVTVPIWFKEPMNEMIVCYCYNISLQEIIKVVKEHKVYTKDEVIKILNKPKNNDCLHSNPIGKECDRLFENAIAYAKGVE